MMKDSESRVVSRRQQPPLAASSSNSTTNNGGSMEMMLPLHRQQLQQQQQQQQGPPPSLRAKRKPSDRIPFLSSGIMGSNLMNGTMASNIMNGTSNYNSNSGIPAPPRSGGSGLPTLSSLSGSLDFFGVGDATDATAKKSRRRYQVQMPCRLLSILALVFLIIPVMIFLHKEGHIHDERAHYRTEKFINVNTQEVFSTFSEATSRGSSDRGGEGGIKLNSTSTANSTNHQSTAAYLLATDAAAADMTGLNHSVTGIEDTQEKKAEETAALVTRQKSETEVSSVTRLKSDDGDNGNALLPSTTMSNSNSTASATNILSDNEDVRSRNSTRRLRHKG